MPTTTIEGIEFERAIQSTFRIKGGGLVVWVDPHKVTKGEKADLILVTHEHFDHLDPDSIKVLEKADTVVVANEPCAKKLKGQVKSRIVSIKEGQSVTEKGVQIKAVPGYNGYHPRDQGYNVGLVFNLAGKNIYHGGDTSKVAEMANMGPVDVALYPIGGTYTSDESDAAEAIKVIKPKYAIPMHYGYATGGDPQKFKSLVGTAAKVEIL